MEEQPEEEKIETFEEKFQNFIGTAKEEVSSLKAELNDITKLYNDFVKKPSTAVPSKAEKLYETFVKVDKHNSIILSIEEKVIDFETKVFGKTPEDKESLKLNTKNCTENGRVILKP
jgi:hypothetical protein